MEDKYQHTIPGQELTESDINTIANEAALADEKVFAEMFRLGIGAKGVVAGSTSGAGGATMASALIQPSGSANATIKINPFRAFIGPLAFGGISATSLSNYKDGRSAVAASSADLTLNNIQLPAATNNRWDLIYARVDVDIDGDSVTRYVKTGSTPATGATVVLNKKTIVSVGRVAGTEATSPAKPTVPADSGSSFYITLGYVLLPAGHTLTSSVGAATIDETAPVVRLSRSTSASTLSVATGNYADAGITMANELWNPSVGRPFTYMPSTMNGKRELIFSLLEFSTRSTIPLGTVGIIDDSTDWRRRMFKAMACLAPTGSTDQLPWFGGSAVFPKGAVAIPDPTGAPQSTVQFMGQSFVDDATAIVGVAGGVVANVDNFTTVGKAGSSVQVVIFVDLADGKLKGWVAATAPARRFFFWLDATGQFNNAF